MATSTLHLNNPVPSNGAVVSSLGGRHTVTVTLAGVGAISCVVQAWGSEQGTDARKIGAPVTVSGTTTVSKTLTFDADCKQFWLQLVSMSPACKFNATVENNGTVTLAGPLLAPQSSMVKVAQVSSWAPHPSAPPSGPSSLTNATGQINVVAPVRDFTHIQVELGNVSTSAYSGLKNIIAAISSRLEDAAPSVGSDVTGNPRTGWVSVATDPEVPARPTATLGEGIGYWLSDKIYLPSAYVTPELRAPVVCLRYWQQVGGATFWWMSDNGAVAVPKSDRMGGLAWARRATSRTTNADCVAGTSASADSVLNAASNLAACVFGRVYFWNGPILVGSSALNRTMIEVFGASTISAYGTVEGSGEPWIGLVGGSLREYGITLGHTARAGATSAWILASAKNRILTSPAQYALYTPFVSNDTDAFEEVGSQLQVNRFFEFAADAESKRIVPISVIMCHNFGTEAQIATREQSIAVLKSSGYPWIDVREWMGRPDSPNMLLPAYTTDNTHFSPAGDEAMAANFPSRLLGVLAQYPRLR